VTTVTPDQLSEFLKDKTKPNWSRLNSGIDGFCVLKFPGVGGTSSLVMEIVLDPEGCESKKRGFLIRSKSEYEKLSKIIGKEAEGVLTNALAIEAPGLNG
jgi:hypothetical protein